MSAPVGTDVPLRRQDSVGTLRGIVSEPWPKERIEALLTQEKFDYQRIELPHGLATPGKERTTSAELLFPADLTGKTVLDLGCNHGYFCFEAIRRGATRVVGYDFSPEIIRKAKLLAQAMGVTVEFVVFDLNSQPLIEVFDYVLCLNVLHHLHNPLSELDELMKVTRERLVLEVAGLSLWDYFRRLDVVPFFAFVLALFPVVYIGRVKAKRRTPEKLKYYFTKGALLRLFSQRKKLFPKVVVVGSRFKGRFLLLADRFE